MSVRPPLQLWPWYCERVATRVCKLRPALPSLLRKGAMSASLLLLDPGKRVFGMCSKPRKFHSEYACSSLLTPYWRSANIREQSMRFARLQLLLLVLSVGASMSGGEPLRVTPPGEAEKPIAAATGSPPPAAEGL